MNPWLILAALALVGVLTGGAYVRGREDGENKIEAQQAREDAIAAVATEAAASAAAQAISKIKVQNRTIMNEVNREIFERPTVYRNTDCAHTPDGLRNINAAITGEARPEPASRGELPASNPSR